MKIVSWNIAGGYILTPQVKNAIGYEKEDIDYFITELKKTHSDIVCLQEAHISKNGKINQTSVVANAFLYNNFATHIYKGSESHINSDYFLSFGTISKYPIISNTYFNPPNPNLSILRPNGKIWKTLDMGIFVSKIMYNGKEIHIANIHLLPLHYYKKDWKDSEFQHIRNYIGALLSKLLSLPTIIIGDFNYADLTKIYSDLFCSDRYKEVFIGDTTPAKGQQDHILYSHHWSLIKYKIESEVKADHYICTAELCL